MIRRDATHISRRSTTHFGQEIVVMLMFWQDAANYMIGVIFLLRSVAIING